RPDSRRVSWHTGADGPLPPASVRIRGSGWIGHGEHRGRTQHHPHEETAETPPWDSTRPRAHENFPRARQNPLTGLTAAHEHTNFPRAREEPWCRASAPALRDRDGGSSGATTTRTAMSSRTLSPEQREELLAALKTRFEANMHRHEAIEWAEVRARLEGDAGKLRSLHEMEGTGGEPDVVGRDDGTGELVFVDCPAESPKGRRSLCYDREAREARKEHKPESSA